MILRYHFPGANNKFLALILFCLFPLIVPAGKTNIKLPQNMIVGRLMGWILAINFYIPSFPKCFEGKSLTCIIQHSSFTESFKWNEFSNWKHISLTLYLHILYVLYCLFLFEYGCFINLIFSPHQHVLLPTLHYGHQASADSRHQVPQEPLFNFVHSHPANDGKERQRCILGPLRIPS